MTRGPREAPSQMFVITNWPQLLGKQGVKPDER